MKVYINHFSLNCAQGSSKEDIKSALFKKGAFKKPELFELVDKKTCPIFSVADVLPSMPTSLKNYDSRNNRLVLRSLQEIEKEINHFIKKYGKKRVGVVFGTSTSGIEESVIARRTNDHQYNYFLQEIGSPALFIKDYFSLEGIAYTVSTACSSGARSFIEAKNLLQNNFCDVVIVGGSDSISELTLNGFHSLKAIDFSWTKPLSKNRKGINIGEGAAVFLLSKEPSDFCFLGGGESSDAYHISSPDPMGKGALLAMEMALEEAGLSASEIDYINLHGTGTEKNDEMESLAIHTLFKNSPFVSSTKALVGHTLGAAGALELAFCLLALEENKVPIHYYDGEYDEKLPSLNVITDEKNSFLKTCMSNSYAFGGNNVSLIIGKEL